LKSLESVKFDNEPVKKLESIFNFGFEEVFNLKFSTLFSIEFKVTPAMTKFSLYYGFAVYPGKNAAAGIPKFRVRINNKIKLENELNPDDFFSKVINKNETEYKPQWKQLNLNLKKYHGNKVMIEFLITQPDKSETDSSYFGISKLQVQERIKVSRNLSNRSKPNIILIVCDALRNDRVFTELTPFLNSFKDKIVNLEPAYTVASWTWPAVTSILTGLYPFKHQVYRYDHHELSEKNLMVQEILQRNGYVTSGFSSNPLIKKMYGYDRGFDSFLELPLVDLNDLLPYIKDWISYFKKYSFFSFIHCMDTHTPYLAPKRFTKHKIINISPEDIQNIILNLNQGGESERMNPELLLYIKEQYNAQVRYFDHTLGKFIKFLEKEKLLENTVLIITSDHGEEFLEHENLTHGFSLFNTLIRVPMLLIGERVNEIPVKDLFSHLDLFPSICDMGEVKQDFNLDGVSFFKPGFPDEIFISTHDYHIRGVGWFSKFGLIHGNFKIVYFPKENQYELFDLEKDPGENYNLAGDETYAQTLSELKGRLEPYLNNEDLIYLSETTDMDNQLQKNLQDLGYL